MSGEAAVAHPGESTKMSHSWIGKGAMNGNVLGLCRTFIGAPCCRLGCREPISRACEEQGQF
eukprot:3177875-Pyramimonas_sp.AAC.1